MHESLMLLLAGLAGVLVGTVFFAGLWWTVRRGVTAPHAALWFLVSLLVRTSALLAVFYVVGRGHWSRMLACVVGFLVARLIVTGVVLPVERVPPPAPEAGHAP